MPRSLYLRLSVTDACNLRCRYCRPERDAAGQESPFTASDDEVLDIIRLIRCDYPIHKIRVTGGEPTLRKDLPRLVARLRAEFPQVELAMTTNGLLLAPMAADLRQAGIDSLNISIDTLDAAAFRRLTRGGNVRTVLAGLQAARAAGYHKIRLNAVLMRTFNGGRLAELVSLAAQFDCELRFIELMPYGEGAAIYDEEYLSGDEALESLQGSFAFLGTAPDSATAARYRFLVAGRERTVGFITTVSHPFCERCDRLRLDSHGRIYACMRTPVGVDLLTPLRAGRIDVVRERIRRETPNKTIPQGVWPGHSLVTIGG
jgi:cyclic pyranopterin phosphate synthase